MSSSSATSNSQRLPEFGSARWVGVAALVSGIIVLLDMVTKWLIERELGSGAERNSIRVLGDFIEVHYARNSGIAFGLLSGSSTIAGALVGFVFVPLIFVLLILASRGMLWALGSGLVFGGALGNLIDRIGDESVTDFISIGRWPSFNVADAAITVGALILITLSLFEHRSASGDEGGSS